MLSKSPLSSFALGTHRLGLPFVLLAATLGRVGYSSVIIRAISAGFRLVIA